MPAIAIGLIFAAIGAAAQTLAWFAALPALFHPTGGTPIVPALVGIVAAAVFGLITGAAGVYALRPRSLWVFVLDVSWSAINTCTGLIFLIYCLIKGSRQPPDRTSQDRGAIWYGGAALPGADATTIGTVMGGMWLVHETVHIQQARLFGPLYWPTYLASYVFNMVARFITGRFVDPHWESYGRVVMEDWAYKATPGARVEVAPSLLWFLLTVVNALALCVLVHALPVVGALPLLLGLGGIPWWIGLAVLLAYALVRSFWDRSRPHVAAATP